MEQERQKRLPKIELHCHLDGSLSADMIGREIGRKVELRELQVDSDCRDLAQYLEKFDIPLQAMQTRAGLEHAGYDFMKQVAKEGVDYVEVRFAPLLSAHDALPSREVVEAVLKGLADGEKDYHVSWNVILCLMRHHSSDQNAEVLRLAKEFLGEGVCAIDLAGNEAAYPMQMFRDIFGQAHQEGVPFTIHGGECGSVENVMDAVACGARRIGHGIALRGHKAEQEILKAKGVGIEMCPISNLQTKAVEKMEDYPMREFLDMGLLVTLNTDNRTVSNTSLEKERAFVIENCHVTEEQIYQMTKNAIDISFASDEVKQKLHQMLREDREIADRK